MSATIWDGESRSLSIETGKKLSVAAMSGTYSVLTTAGAGAGTALATNATGGTYGPYAGPITVLLSSSALSEIDFDVAVTPVIESDTFVKASKTLTGEITFSAGEFVVPAITNFTFATLPSAALWSGRIARVTDLNNALFESNGTRWKPVNGSAVIASLDTDTAMSGTTEAIVLQKALPAGLLKNGDRIRVRITGGKSSTSEQMTLGFRLGTAGTIADTSVQSYAFLNTTSISAGVLVDFKRLSATTVRKLGNGSQATSMSGTSTAPVVSPVTVANMDSNITYLTATLLMSAAVETATIYDMTFELVSAGA